MCVGVDRLRSCECGYVWTEFSDCVSMCTCERILLLSLSVCTCGQSLGSCDCVYVWKCLGSCECVYVLI